MRRLNQTLLLLLLIVAIPVQGFAARAMRMCAPGHHGEALTGHVTADHPAEHQHRHSAQTQDAQDNCDQDVAIAGSDLNHGKCSACASCCVALAIVSGRLNIENVVTAAAAIPFLAGAFISHISDGFDPPPRVTIA